MKKNLFKFAYVALAVVSMISLGQKKAYANYACAAACGKAEGACLSGGGGNACQGPYVDCMVACG